MKHLINFYIFLIAGTILYAVPSNVASDAVLTGNASLGTVIGYGIGLIMLTVLSYNIGKGNRDKLIKLGYLRAKKEIFDEEMERL